MVVYELNFDNKFYTYDLHNVQRQYYDKASLCFDKGQLRGVLDDLQLNKKDQGASV